MSLGISVLGLVRVWVGDDCAGTALLTFLVIFVSWVGIIQLVCGVLCRIVAVGFL